MTESSNFGGGLVECDYENLPPLFLTSFTVPPPGEYIQHHHHRTDTARAEIVRQALEDLRQLEEDEHEDALWVERYLHGAPHLGGMPPKQKRQQ